MASSSTSKAELVRGTHLFRVADFSLLEDNEFDWSIKSSRFKVGGHVWFIILNAFGPKDDSSTDEENYSEGVDEEDVSLWLCRRYSSQDVAARFKFTICDQSGKEKQDIRRSWSRTHIFTGEVNSWGYNEFCKRSDLRDPKRSLIKDNSILIRCDVCVVRRETTLDWDQTNRRSPWWWWFTALGNCMGMEEDVKKTA